MKVALVVPTSHYTGDYPSFLSLSDFPTGFAYLASSLKKAGHEVIGINPNNITGYPSAKIMLHSVLTRRIQETNPDLIGLGGLCTDYAFLRDAIEIIRNITNAPIVLGGQIVNNDAEDVYKLLKPDYAVVGEGESSLLDIAAGHVNKGIIHGVHTQDLDSLPFPDYEPFNVRDMLDNYSGATRLLYRYSRPYPRPFVIVASRSCPFSCTFCVHGKRELPYRARSIDNIIQEITETYEKYKYNILLIDDELFAVNKERMNEFSRRILQGKEELGWDFDWMFQTHASAKLDLESMKLAREAGCFLFSYGLESASPTVLKSMNKKIEVSQVINALELAHQSNIGFSANLIFGDIAETVDTWAESLSFWLEHGRQDFIFLANLMPYPGTKLFDSINCQDKKSYYENIDTGVFNMTTIPNHRFQELLKVNQGLERAWLFVPLAKNVRIEHEGHGMYKIQAECPYCGKEILYRNPFNSANGVSIGTGCTHCNRKIKIEA
jgi:anaerobic magnesium-protoporphyrin IX monomethyl ester cyclase